MTDLRVLSNMPGAELAELIQDLSPSAVLLVTDSGAKKHCYRNIKPLLPKHALLELPPGEVAKDIVMAHAIWAKLLGMQADRDALVVCLGGGSVTDVGGFAASTYKRGVRTLLLPTTLMAQADAALGGKTGIDVQSYKNAAGTFWPPAAVLSYTPFLQTLPYGQLLSGWAEVLKHSLLSGQNTWAAMREREADDPTAWPEAIALSNKVKNEIVAQDPHDAGARRALNLGHTLGHALESFLIKAGRPTLHGHAVALGLLAEAYIAHRQKLTHKALLHELEETILSQYPLPEIDKGEYGTIAKLALQDKKNAGGRISYVALHAAGRYDVNATCSLAEIKAGLGFLVGF